MKWEKPDGVKELDTNFWNEDCLLGYDPSLPVPDTRPLIITEGEFDRVAAIQALGDSYNVMSLPGGALTKADILEKNHHRLKHVKELIICSDNDGPGEDTKEVVFYYVHHMHTLARTKAENRVQVYHVEYPQDCKDLNDVLLLNKNGNDTFYGEEQIRQCVSQKKILSVPDAEIMFDDNFVYDDEVEILKTGTEFDDYLVLPSAELVVLQGFTGHGKSQFATWLLYKMALYENCRIAIFCLETKPSRYRRDFFHWFYDGKLVERTKEKSHRRRGIVPKANQRWATEEEVQEFEQFNRKHIIYIKKKKFAKYPTDIDWVRKTVTSYGQREDMWIKDTCKSLGDMADDLNTCVMVCAHPKTTDNEDKPPMAEDIKGGTEMVKRCGLAFSYFRQRGWIEDLDDGSAQLKVFKVRDRELYGIHEKLINLTFNPRSKQYQITDVEAPNNKVVPFTDGQETRKVWQREQNDH